MKAWDPASSHLDRGRAALNEGAMVQRSLRWAILATMLVGTILAVLDSSILNIYRVAAPGVPRRTRVSRAIAILSKA